MSGKRQAASDLNHDNWDREEEPEERGTFRTATEEELKSRVIKKAKRTIAPGTSKDAADGTSGVKSVFSGFAGFGKSSTATTAPTSSPFSFLSKIPVTSSTSSVVCSTAITTNSTPTFSFGIGSEAVGTTKVAENSKPSTLLENSISNVTSAKSGENSSFSKYCKNLSSLNQAVCEWIKTHVDQNPLCILSPIFKDYEKHLEKIENEKKLEVAKETSVGNENVAGKTLSATSVETFKFSVKSSSDAMINSKDTTSKTSETESKTNGFSFEKPVDKSHKPITPALSFGINPATSATAEPSTATSSPSFSFGIHTNSTNQSVSPTKPFCFTPSSTPFSFGNIKPSVASSTTSSKDDSNEEQDDEVPKIEFKQVVEDDAVYSKKCKVFVKKEGNFVDKGVGTLHLKPVESTGKTQLLVRADTNLGNILINLILNAAIPCQRMGKNNVMMICLPTPDVEKPTSILLRVKTSEEADELLETIEKYKK